MLANGQRVQVSAAVDLRVLAGVLAVADRALRWRERMADRIGRDATRSGYGAVRKRSGNVISSEASSRQGGTG